MIQDQSGEVKKRSKQLNLTFLTEGTMNYKSITWKKLIDISLITFLLLLIFFPSIRTPVMGGIQHVLLQSGFFNAQTEESKKEASVDVEQLKLTDLEGSPVSTNELIGRTLFINVWATWCPPCLAEMPDIANLYQSIGQEVAFIMISVDKNQDKARAWVNKKQYPVPVYFVNGKLPEDLLYEAIPTTWVVNSNGIIRYQHSGMAKYHTPEFREFLLSQ